MAQTKITNEYTINPRNISQYNAFRGVTDFTNISQFSQYEAGYQALFVLQMPYFMEQLDPIYTDSFRHMLEYEFKGLDGLSDISTESMTISDGINEMNLISKVTYDTSIQISSEYYEKTGSFITKYIETYLTGIKDKNSQAKHYHGLIADNKINDPGPDKEIMTMLYVVTDSTMLRVERAILLANCQFTKAETSMYNGTRGDIGSNKTISIEWNAYPVMNNLVDKAAKHLLELSNGYNITYASSADNKYNNGGLIQNVSKANRPEGYKGSINALDSTEYKYGIMETSEAGNIIGRTTESSVYADNMVNPTADGKEFVNELKGDKNNY